MCYSCFQSRNVDPSVTRWLTDKPEQGLLSEVSVAEAPSMHPEEENLCQGFEGTAIRLQTGTELLQE